MSMNLNIPITQTITLPDSWQACKTPQELSYWIIAKFDNFTTQFTEINNAMSALQSMIETNTDNIATNDAEIAEIKNTLTSINSNIATLKTDYNTLNTDLTTLSGLHHQLSNKVAGMEDAVLDLPGIKNDISTLQTNVASNSESINTINTGNVTRDQNIQGLLTVVEPRFFINSTTPITIAGRGANLTTVVILNSAVDYRQFIRADFNESLQPLGLSFIVYYNSDYNVPFSHYDSTIGGTDITNEMESHSIDGSIALTEVITKTKVAIRFFKVRNTSKKFSWTVL